MLSFHRMTIYFILSLSLLLNFSYLGLFWCQILIWKWCQMKTNMRCGQQLADFQTSLSLGGTQPLHCAQFFNLKFYIFGCDSTSTSNCTIVLNHKGLHAFSDCFWVCYHCSSGALVVSVVSDRCSMILYFNF